MFIEGSRTDLENLRVGGEKVDLLLLRVICFHGGLMLAHVVWEKSLTVVSPTVDDDTVRKI